MRTKKFRNNLYYISELTVSLIFSNISAKSHKFVY